MALGDYLRRKREEKGMTLRDIENALKQLDDTVRVSSGHLSLIEQGKVSAPSPKTLHALAKAIGLDYVDLMVEAGYLEPSALKERPSSAVAFRGAEKLNPEQVRQVEDYIDYLRSKRHRQHVAKGS